MKNTSTRACTNTCAAFNSRDCIDHRVVALDRDRSAHVFGTSAADACAVFAAFCGNITAENIDSAAVFCFAQISSILAGADTSAALTAGCVDRAVVDPDAHRAFLVTAADACAELLACGSYIAAVDVCARAGLLIAAADACRISAARGCDIAGVDPNSRCFVGLLSLVAADACTVGAARCFNGRAENIDIAARLVVSSAYARIIFFSGGDDLARSVNVQGRMLFFLS